MPEPTQVVMAVPEVLIDPKVAVALKDQISALPPQPKELEAFLSDVLDKIEVSSEYTYTFDSPLKATDPFGADLLLIDGDHIELISGRVLLGAGTPLPVVSCEYDPNKNWTVVRFAPRALPPDLSTVSFTGPPPPAAEAVVEASAVAVVEPTAFTVPLDEEFVSIPQPAPEKGPDPEPPPPPPSPFSRIKSFFTGK